MNISAIVGSHDIHTANKTPDWSRQRYIERFPWKAVIPLSRRDDCRGTLISNKHVIVRASCVLQGLDPSIVQNR